MPRSAGISEGRGKTGRRIEIVKIPRRSRILGRQHHKSRLILRSQRNLEAVERNRKAATFRLDERFFSSPTQRKSQRPAAAGNAAEAGFFPRPKNLRSDLQ